MNRKKLFTVAVIVCLIALLSMGTVAWFSASDSVTNKFMIASSDDPKDPEDIFSIDVYEYVGDDGELNQDGDEAVYNDILPGDSLKKEVYAKNTGAYDQFVRVTVTVSDARAWMNVLGVTDVPAISKIVKGYDSSMWSPRSGAYLSESNKFVYELYYIGVLTPGSAINVFDSVEIPGSMTKEQAAAFNGGFDIDVKADAVQTENVGANAKEAFATVGL
ncbi:MAG: SipW-dependent-type signal peptide-containing protein [Firmicutes bacterium]|nr:SipW-dependent-type signal peptide-containing protein [Bacillota bacterium]MBR3788081.1 SipW-dependent-type signal peptide-containing protein [Bacillota bacterium]